MSDSAFESGIDFSKIRLKRIVCPTCGAPLQFGEGDKEVVCMCCGNKYQTYMFKETPSQTSQVKSGGTGMSVPVSAGAAPQAGGVIKVDGIKTSSSALAYVEQFLDSYDWFSFAYDADYTIDELTEVIENIKIASADDYKTWMAAIYALVIPFSKKIEYRQKIFDEIVEEYKRGNLDSYALYDEFHIVSSVLLNSFDSVLETANQYLRYAEKYDLPKDINKELKKLIDGLDRATLEEASKYATLDDVPAIQEYVQKQEKALYKELTAQGIDPDQYLEKAQALISQKDYLAALQLLLPLKTYKFANKRVEFINSFFRIQEVFISQGDYYFLNKGESAYTVHRIVDSKIEDEPYIRDVAKLITCYAGVLYFFNKDGKICGFDLVTGKAIYETKNSYSQEKYYFRPEVHKCYFVISKDGSYQIKALDLMERKMISVTDTSAENKIEKILRIFDKYALVLISTTLDGKTKKTITLIDLDTKENLAVSKKEVLDNVLFDNKLAYTNPNPSANNKSLYAFNIETRENICLEKNIVGNIFGFNNRVYFFTEDNLKRRYLVSINPDGTDRRELSQYAKAVLFEIGEWIYFIKSYRYNIALCKMKYDGSQTRVIAYQIDKIIKIEGGYIYFIDNDKELRKVRNDGTREQVLAYNVQTVVKVTADKLVYQAADDKYRKSLYAIDFNQVGRRKASYDIASAKSYDESTVAYIKHATIVEKDKDGNEVTHTGQRYLCMMNIHTYEEKIIAKLVKVEVKNPTTFMKISSILSWIFGMIWVVILFIIAGTGNAVSIEYCYERTSYNYWYDRPTTYYDCYKQSSAAGWALVIIFVILRIAILVVRQITLKKKKMKLPMGILTLCFASVLGGILTLCIRDSEYKD